LSFIVYLIITFDLLEQRAKGAADEEAPVVGGRGSKRRAAGGGGGGGRRKEKRIRVSESDDAAATISKLWSIVRALLRVTPEEKTEWLDRSLFDSKHFDSDNCDLSQVEIPRQSKVQSHFFFQFSHLLCGVEKEKG
jgi:hypothetical protein